jgi:hypothetical protein
VTGYTYKSGFAGEEATSSLVDVTCESCHGPASLHVAAPNKPYGRPLGCKTCHHPDHSPKFEKPAYWEKIKH